MSDEISSAQSWWTVRTDAPEPMIRWLGVFSETLQLAIEPAGCLERLASPIGPATRIDRGYVQPRVAHPLAGDANTAHPADAWLATPTLDRASSVGAEPFVTGHAGSLLLGASREGASREADVAGAPRLGERTTQPRAAPALAAVRREGDPAIPLWKRLALLLQPPLGLLLSDASPVEWPASLFPFQIEGIHALLSNEALLLADDMGLGKTVQTIAALRVLTIQRQIERCLLVAPASLILQWRRAIGLWAPELRVSTIRGPKSDRAWQWAAPAHIYLTSYDTLREDFTSNPQSPPRRTVWDVVIIDEAQRIKNREADISRKVKLLPRRRAWALTGTPLENDVEDLASILEFVAPLDPGATPQRLQSGPDLYHKHHSLQLRRKKGDVLPQLSPKLVSEVVVSLDDEQRQTYDRAEHLGILRLREQGEDVRIESVLELILRLKQICNFCPATGRSAKMTDLIGRVRTLVAEGHRALIFSQFTDSQHGVEAIANRLRPFQPLVFTGRMSSAERDQVIDQFRSESRHQVLVLSLRAGGQGLNLQEASYVFHFDRWWNPAIEHQAEDRSHRMGQTVPVNVFKYLCENTIEERIDQILRRKQALFDELVDDVTLDLRAKLTEEELLGLFDLRRR